MTPAERALLLAVAGAVKELNPGLYLEPLIAAIEAQPEPPLCDAGNMIVTCLGSLVVDGEPTTLPPGTRVSWMPIRAAVEAEAAPDPRSKEGEEAMMREWRERDPLGSVLEGLEDMPETVITRDQWEGAAEVFMGVRQADTKPTEAVCPVCKGTGMTVFNACQDMCWTCDGTGKEKK